MALELRRIRRSSIALILLGILLGWWGLDYGAGLGWLGYVPVLSKRYQIGEAVWGVGAFLVGAGLVRLFRRKGDYDDFDDPGNEGHDGI